MSPMSDETTAMVTGGPQNNIMGYFSASDPIQEQQQPIQPQVFYGLNQQPYIMRNNNNSPPRKVNHFRQ